MVVIRWFQSYDTCDWFFYILEDLAKYCGGHFCLSWKLMAPPTCHTRFTMTITRLNFEYADVYRGNEISCHPIIQAADWINWLFRAISISSGQRKALLSPSYLVTRDFVCSLVFEWYKTLYIYHSFATYCLTHVKGILYICLLAYTTRSVQRDSINVCNTGDYRRTYSCYATKS